MSPAWLYEAERHIGLKEVVGPMHNKTILSWLAKLGAWWREDETPWCGTFVAHCMDTCGLPYPKAWYRAKAWSDYGVLLRPDRLSLGAILVFDRAGGGHVCFYAGESDTHYYVLGGNQSNMVCYTWIAKERLVASRWPKGRPVIGGRVFMKRTGEVSKNEE